MFHYNKCETPVEYVNEVFDNKKMKNKEAVEILFEDYYSAGKSYTVFFEDTNKIKVISNGSTKLFFKNKKDCKLLLQPIRATLML